MFVFAQKGSNIVTDKACKMIAAIDAPELKVLSLSTIIITNPNPVFQT